MIARFPQQQAVSTDAVVVGAGPVGLFQVFELGLLGLRAEVIDSLRGPGGQCTELYPDKPIYDIPAVPVCTGRELTLRLLQQIAPFSPGLHYGQEVTRLERQSCGRFLVGTSAGALFDAGVVVIAAGVGAFQPRRLDVEGAAQLEGNALHYRVADESAFAGRDLLICGGGDSAVDWAVALAGKARSVVVVHRRAEFRAAHATLEKLRLLQEQGSADILTGSVQSLDRGDGKHVAVRVACSDGLVRRVVADHILVFFGLHPKLGPIAQWGLDLDRKALKVDSARFETSVSGIYAVGDINTYPGKKKLILCGFHEAALAAFAAKEHLNPGEKVRLQYTTTSPVLHRRLRLDDESDTAAA
ncbi:MAG TPA: NAD(P)/FAD-dependent oxidoreductase [Steroidobacteraceae bacterium]|nr:NAD(P)/FAD-dependent oxidoreductase [Steroidobacteraceae bacterium]